MWFYYHKNQQRSRKYTSVLGGASLLLLAGLIWTVTVGMSTPTETLRTGRYPAYTSPRLTDLFSILTPAYAAATGEASNRPVSIVIEDFNAWKVGGFPEDWKAYRGDDNYVRKLYKIQEEAGNRYLKAQDDGTSIIIRKRLESWNPHEYPILSWRWRARALPKGGNEREETKNDSAVAIYVVLDQNFLRIPKTLKYVWSTTLPVGTEYRRDGIGRPHVIVLRSGPDRLGQWVSESVNVREDFIRVFGKEPPTSAVGIGILTDGNATKTNSAGDYDDFVIHRYRDGS